MKETDKKIIFSLIVLFIFSSLFIFNLEEIYAQSNENGYVTIQSEEDETTEENKEEMIDFKWKEGSLKEPLDGDKLLSFRGIDFYPYPRIYENERTLHSLDALLRVEEVNWVQLRFFLFQDDRNGNEIKIKEEQDERLVEMIKKIHKTGRKVSLQPHLVVEEYDAWAGVINPADVDQWFSSYSKAFLHYAKLAEKHDVELLPIGNEYVPMWKHNEEWKALIKEIRKNYNGEITTKINAWWQKDYLEKVLEWEWLSELDYIGISPYFDLIREKNPTLEDVKASWRNTHHELNAVESLEMISDKFDKDIIFLEIGYRSIEGTVMEPWNSKIEVPANGKNHAVPNQEAQVVAVQALFDVFLEKDWFKGVFWFLWPTEIIVDPEGTGWSIPGTKAEKVIWDNFREEQKK